MAERRAGRPFIYQSEDEKPVSFSVRIPRGLYEQAQKYVKMRPKTTLTELLLDGLRLRLETPADPRDLILSDDNTVMQEIQEMVDAAVERRLAQGQATPPLAPTAPAPAPALSEEEIAYSNGHTAVHGRGDMRRRILTLLQRHPGGLSGNQITALLNPDKPLGDTLQGMHRQNVVRVEGSGKAKRYFAG
jgi:hypothetical protein